ncbi:MAG: cytochrome C [Planctomycetota bacterium]
MKTTATRFRLLALPGLACALAAVLACSRTGVPLPLAGDPARGHYLVEQVGMCQDCHTPRDDEGQFDRSRWLQGAAIPFQPTAPMPWAPASAYIAGLPTLTDQQAVTFLTSGELPGHRRPRPPMPDYRLDQRDALDVVAYLRSLGKPEAPAR